MAINETIIAAPSITQMTAATANLRQNINTREKPVQKLQDILFWKNGLEIIPREMKNNARISFQHRSKSSDTS